MGRLSQVAGTGTNTRFVYDGDELVAEYDANGIMARRYVHSDNVDDPVVQYNGAAMGAAARTFLMPDERGSIAGLFDNSGNSLAKNSAACPERRRRRRRRDEYGIPGAANQGRFQYTGQAWLPELGMYYYKARLYSPTLGRFLQVDPIGYDDQVNLYAYVGSDPINGRDPTGKACYGGVNDGTAQCQRSAIYAAMHRDARINSRTTFFAGASIVTAALANKDIPGAGMLLSPTTSVMLNRMGGLLLG